MTKVETGKKPAKADAAQKERDRNTALRLFIGAVLDMSWQLALIVLVPLVGGFELYKHNHGLLWLFILGIIIAVVGSYAVIRRMYAQYSQISVAPARDKK